VSLLARAVAATASGGRKSGGCQGHHLLWRESRAVIDSVVIDGDPVALDDLPCAEAMECQFNVGSGDGGENQWGQSAPRRSPRKPVSYKCYLRFAAQKILTGEGNFTTFPISFQSVMTTLVFEVG